MKKYLFILTIIAFLSISPNVYASSMFASLDCPTSAKANSTISCKVSAYPIDNTLKGIQANIDIINAAYYDFSLAEGWIAYANNNIGFSLGRESALFANTLVGNLEVIMPNSGDVTISLTNIYGSSHLYETLDGNSLTKTIKVQSGINNLSSVTIAGNQLNPAFDPDSVNYDILVNEDTESINISATLESLTSKFVNGFGPREVAIDYGNNEVLLKVQAEDGSIKTYTINVKREDNRSNDSSLLSLSVDPAKIIFNKNNKVYHTSVDYHTTRVNVKYKANHEKAKVEVIGSSNLAIGNNKIIIKVTAENQEVTEYVINIIRQEKKTPALNGDSSLKNLVINGQKINLTESKTYVVELEKEMDMVKVDAVANNSKATVKVHNNQNVVDGTIISVVVTAEDGSVSNYSISCLVKATSNESNIVPKIIIIVVILIVFAELCYKYFKKKRR